MRWKRYGDPLGLAPRKIAAVKCSIEGCDSPPRHRGMCSTHYGHLLKSTSPKCSIENCAKPSIARGLCSAHWSHWRKYENPRTDIPQCSVEGCEKSARTRGLCQGHYTRWRRHSDPTICLNERSDTNLLKQFMRNALAYEGDECLLWPFGKNEHGYGLINYKGRKGLAHRFICDEVHGDPPTSSHEAAHGCGNGHLGCITPNHLQWATHAENVADMDLHGTRMRGEMAPGAKLTEKDVMEIRSMSRTHSIKMLASIFGVSKGAIYHIINRVNWKHVA